MTDTERETGNQYDCTVKETHLSKYSTVTVDKELVVTVWTVLTFKMDKSVECICICCGVITLRFLPTSGCIQDPISLTSQWITAATAGFTSIRTVKKKKNNTAQDLTMHTLTNTSYYQLCTYKINA